MDSNEKNSNMTHSNKLFNSFSLITQYTRTSFSLITQYMRTSFSLITQYTRTSY